MVPVKERPRTQRCDGWVGRKGQRTKADRRQLVHDQLGPTVLHQSMQMPVALACAQRARRLADGGHRHQLGPQPGVLRPGRWPRRALHEEEIGMAREQALAARHDLRLEIRRIAGCRYIDRIRRRADGRQRFGHGAAAQAACC